MAAEELTSTEPPGQVSSAAAALALPLVTAVVAAAATLGWHPYVAVYAAVIAAVAASVVGVPVLVWTLRRGRRELAHSLASGALGGAGAGALWIVVVLARGGDQVPLPSLLPAVVGLVMAPALIGAAAGVILWFLVIDRQRSAARRWTMAVIALAIASAPSVIAFGAMRANRASRAGRTDSLTRPARMEKGTYDWVIETAPDGTPSIVRFSRHDRPGCALLISSADAARQMRGAFNPVRVDIAVVGSGADPQRFEIRQVGSIEDRALLSSAKTVGCDPW
jgi:hypothetical protein